MSHKYLIHDESPHGTLRYRYRTYGQPHVDRMQYYHCRMDYLLFTSDLLTLHIFTTIPWRDALLEDLLGLPAIHSVSRLIFLNWGVMQICKYCSRRLVYL